jgi:hypothetical protein
MASVSYFLCAAEGATLRHEGDAVELIGDARGSDLILIPAQRLDEDFFRLRTGVAGAFLQKFATYGKCVAILGDISRYVQASSALRDLVVEANRGDHVWFVETVDDLERHVTSSQQFS